MASSNKITLSIDQQKVYDKLINFITSDKENEIMLSSCAGSGKTFLTTFLINNVIKKKICKRVVVAAPTHKALNIAKSKLFSSSEDSTISANINIMTIHRLLNYQQFIDSDGKIYFAKSSADINWSIYNLIIIDECSMLSNQIIDDIEHELKKPYNKNIKLIFLGDSCQIPPVSQSESKIFTRNIKTLTLDKIIRTNSTNIMELSNGHRKWINTLNDDDMPKISDFLNDKINIYPSDNPAIWLDKFVGLTQDIDKQPSKIKKSSGKKKKTKANINIVEEEEEKTESEENKLQFDNIEHLDNNIILTWTNKKCNKYNNYIRHKLFNKKDLERYELGEMLIFNDFHRIEIEIEIESESKDNQDDNKDVNKEDTKKIISFYTSEQVRLKDMRQDKYKFVPILNTKNKDIPDDISNRIVKAVTQINNKISDIEVDVYYMNVQKISDLKTCSKLARTYEVLVIHEKSEIEYNKLMEFFEEQMVKLKNKTYSMIQELKNADNMTKCDYQGVVDKKINKIWTLWQTNVIDKFAQLNYGYAITVHKSQGSTFRNVFVDISDIFENHNKKETLKCLYTAITRSSETLELLI
jgi:hypothetical protein